MRALTPPLRVVLGLTLFAAPFLASCGTKPKGGGGDANGARIGRAEKAFRDAAHTSKVPIRFLMALGYLESRLAPERATANYQTSPDAGGGAEPMAVRGTAMTETAFGMSFAQLGLDPAKAQSGVLEVQIEAYARMIGGFVSSQGLGLAASPKTPEDKFAWIENLANLHREKLPDRRNVQAIFARELIRTLNEGFIWQDPRSGEKLELTPEKPPLDPASFPENGRAWFDLKADEGQIPGSTYFRLVTVPTGEFENHPRRIEVIHCPLTLSACLELQSGVEDDDERVHMAAHYVVPPNGDVFKGVIQVARHKDVVVVTDKLGQHKPVDDAIVVMLVGNSGRIVDGKRVPALPDWFTDEQLRRLGQVVGDVCARIVADYPGEVAREQCLSTTGDLGVQFRRQATAEEYRWGDVPDYDATIFDAYVKSPGGLGTEAAFEFKKNKRRFKKGEPIPLTVLFNSTVKTAKVERLARCTDGKVIWEPVETQDVRGEKKVTFTDKRYDSGPNRNGDQFYRARVYAGDSHLIGWAIARVVLANFEPEAKFAADDVCASAAQR